MAKEYSDLLKHPYWQRKRLTIMDRDGWTCRRCSDTFTQLQVHHLWYNDGKNPWEYPDEALITLCDLCHMKAEFFKWVNRFGALNLLKSGFERNDISEIKELVFRRVDENKHRESVVRYMDGVKLLMSNG